MRTSDGSRIDSVCTKISRYWVEVKNVSLRLSEGVGFQTVLQSVVKHLKVLTGKVLGGERAALVYNIGRTDVETIFGNGHRSGICEAVKVAGMRE